MKEHPILFSAPMVRAILDGRKTQTRRVIKLPKKWAQRFPICAPHHMKADNEVWWHGPETERVGVAQDCPYGKPGDRLWVRETMGISHFGATYSADDTYFVRCDDEENDARLQWWHDRYLRRDEHRAHDEIGFPSIFMPRWACRIELEVTNVRAELLKDCSETDAEAEGCDQIGVETGRFDGNGNPIECGSFLAGYAELWDRINGPGSWDANPWVWVVEFKRSPKTNLSVSPACGGGGAAASGDGRGIS